MSKSTGKSPAPATLAPCNACRWAVDEGNGLLRCHVNPPQLRVPYDNLAAWPVVPSTGGGCRLWQEQGQPPNKTHHVDL